MASAPRILEGGEWTCQRWWYKLVHVCQRWRYLILHLTSYLSLSLVCAYATPVADMLANSPDMSHLPLTIDHLDEMHHVTTEVEDGILLVPQQHDHVHRIRLWMSVLNSQKLVIAIHGEFPLLEYLYIMPMPKNDMSITLPETFRATHLHHLIMENLSLLLPVGLLFDSDSDTFFRTTLPCGDTPTKAPCQHVCIHAMVANSNLLT